MRTAIAGRNVKRLASVMILVLLAVFAPVVAGFGAREVAPEVPDALSPVYFAAGATELGRRDMSILDGHAAWLRGDRKRILLIEGHTDEPGDSAFSRAVGDQRAQSVKAYLVSKGLPADRITTASRGGARPICEEKTPTCRALNRRASFSPGVLP